MSGCEQHALLNGAPGYYANLNAPASHPTGPEQATPASALPGQLLIVAAVTLCMGASYLLGREEARHSIAAHAIATTPSLRTTPALDLPHAHPYSSARVSVAAPAQAEPLPIRADSGAGAPNPGRLQFAPPDVAPLNGVVAAALAALGMMASGLVLWAWRAQRASPVAWAMAAAYGGGNFGGGSFGGPGGMGSGFGPRPPSRPPSRPGKANPNKRFSPPGPPGPGRNRDPTSSPGGPALDPDSVMGTSTLGSGLVMPGMGAPQGTPPPGAPGSGGFRGGVGLRPPAGGFGTGADGVGAPEKEAFEGGQFLPPDEDETSATKDKSVDELRAVLASRSQPWFEATKYIQALLRRGMSPSMIDECSGIPPIEQSKYHIQVCLPACSGSSSSRPDHTTDQMRTARRHRSKKMTVKQPAAAAAAGQ